MGGFAVGAEVRPSAGVTGDPAVDNLAGDPKAPDAPNPDATGTG
jgi:hypothetical protein